MTGPDAEQREAPTTTALIDERDGEATSGRLLCGAEGADEADAGDPECE